MKKEKKMRCVLWVAPDLRNWLIQRAEKEGRSVSGLGAFLLRGIKEREARVGK